MSLGDVEMPPFRITEGFVGLKEIAMPEPVITCGQPEVPDPFSLDCENLRPSLPTRQELTTRGTVNRDDSRSTRSPQIFVSFGPVRPDSTIDIRHSAAATPIS